MNEKDKKGLPPMLEHYDSVKKQYPDCIIFYRLGDFYEMFFEDAIEISRVLDLTLTARAKAPMCGVPFHAMETYLAKLIDLGYKVAICEQLTEAEKGKKVERDVVRVVTPGTVIEDCMLDDRKNNYIMCIYKEEGKIALCYADITTGEFKVQLLAGENLESQLIDVLTRVSPKEVIGNMSARPVYSELPLLKVAVMPKFQLYYEWAFSEIRADKNLKAQFGENYEKVFELSDSATIIASGALLEYLGETQKRMMKGINKIAIVRNDNFLILDTNTRRNLELTESIRERKKYGSLLWLLDKTKTSMGGRRFRQMFDEPLRSAKMINERLSYVEEIVKKIVLRDRLSEILSQVNDIERLAGKISYGNISPKEMISLKKSLFALPEIKKILLESTKLSAFSQDIFDFKDITDLLERAIVNDPPVLLRDGGYIKKGFNKELDELQKIVQSGDNWTKDLEKAERERTGIQNLTVDHNRVFGYYIQVNKKDADRVPLDYERRQTVSNNERFVTEDLKHMEQKVTSASEDAIKLEAKLYALLKETLLEYVEPLQKTAKAIAEIDCFVSLANCAVKYGYVKPNINTNKRELKIIEGRHPVVESFLKVGQFISNDTSLNDQDERTMIITGPNMAGKSTYMRQVALITFMAHIGSFVPAKSADICLCDRIFTRVGASDDLAFGQSTFMVEMSEVANILANATDESLIILDEIGRGTSTFDGLSIAWSVVEHISKNLSAKTLFATHYHELTDLEGVLDGVKNYKVAVKELSESVVFLHKIVRGGANKSFGIEVARLAGVPSAVLKRAKEISEKLEKVNKKLDLDIFKEDRTKAEDNSRLAQEVLGIIKDIDINRISPLTAFDILADLVNKAKEE